VTAAPRQTVAQRRYAEILAADKATGGTLSNTELAARTGYSKDQCQRARRSTGRRRRAKGGGRKRSASTRKTASPSAPATSPAETASVPHAAAVPGPGDAEAAFATWHAQLDAGAAEDPRAAFLAGWGAREEAADPGIFVSKASAFFAREAARAEEEDDREGARALYRDLVASADKAAKHRPTAAQAANLVDPASFPELNHATMAKMRRYKERLQRERDEKIQRQLTISTERGGEFLTGATDMLRAIGELPAAGDGGDDDGENEA
jgi:hypothetical protein